MQIRSWWSSRQEQAIGVATKGRTGIAAKAVIVRIYVYMHTDIRHCALTSHHARKGHSVRWSYTPDLSVSYHSSSCRHFDHQQHHEQRPWLRQSVDCSGSSTKCVLTSSFWPVQSNTSDTRRGDVANPTWVGDAAAIRRVANERRSSWRWQLADIDRVRCQRSDMLCVANVRVFLPFSMWTLKMTRA